jgi:hypothetical protein
MDKDDVQTLEQIRQRLVTISGNIQQSKQQFQFAQAENSLPTWYVVKYLF